MLLEKERQEVIEYGKKMSKARLSIGTSGNISIYNEKEKLMAISPSGIEYFDIKMEDIVVMNLEGEIIEGDKKPSSEWALHTEMYKLKSEYRAVIHTHSMYCTVFAALHQPLKSVHYVLGDANVSTVPCAPYRTFGTKGLANVVAKTIGKGDAVLLANHGMIACGKNIKSAYGLACNLEFCAELQYRAMCIGKPIVIDDEEMKKVMEKFKSYGQSKKSDK